MNLIQKLDELTINQIAAGEVVESPASALKELVENAIDAGAREIEVETKGGGFQLLRVTDDGVGMSGEDALLCIERHATSKMRSVLDLNSLLSMGFRGEALSSIASISEMEIRTSNGQEGNAVQVNTGEIISKTALDLRKGTSIFIRNLFLNVPARKKFQKSKSASSGEIHRLMKQFLIAYPEIQFRLIQDGIEVFYEQASSFQERVQNLFDVSMQPKHFLEYREKEWSVEGLVGSPSQVKPTRLGQYVFLNRRMIVSPEISFAVSDGFGVRVDKGKHPIYILHLKIPPKEIDVNVHPQKKHVRFQDPIRIKSFIRNAIQQLFLKGMHVPKASFSLEPEKTEKSEPWLFEEQTFAKDKEEDFLVFQKKEPQKQTGDLLEQAPIIHSYGVFEGYLLLNAEVLTPAFFKETQEEAELVFLHLKRAQQRVFFEKSLEHFLHNSQKLQKTIEPIEWQVSREDAELIEKNKLFFLAMGFDLKRFGMNTYMLESHEELWPRSSLLLLCEELLSSCKHSAEKEEINENLWLKRTSKLLKKISKKYWTKAEAEHLLVELFKTKNPFISPLGEKIFLKLKGQDIEKKL